MNPKIVYHISSPPPRIIDTDAVVNEVSILASRFNSHTIQTYPLKFHSARVPIQLYGLRQLMSLRTLEKGADIHHLFCSRPIDFPYLHLLNKPIVITINGSLPKNENTKKAIQSLIKRKYTIILEDESYVVESNAFFQEKLQHIPPMVNLKHIQLSNPPEGKFTLLMASSPWTKGQFQSKGVDLWFDFLKRNKDVKMILVWRGFHFNKIQSMINEYNVCQQIEIVNEHVDINEYLAKVHVTVLITSSPGIVKAYPHSLLESLAAAKPVICSNNMGISKFCKENGYGIVMESFTSEELNRVMVQLRESYEQFRLNCLSFTSLPFSKTTVVKFYLELYRTIQENTKVS